LHLARVVNIALSLNHLIFQKYIFRLRHSRVGRNAAASYLAFISTTVTGLISIPLAVQFLTKEELGLWAVIIVVTGYLNFMEMGLGVATGRMMADSIIAKDKSEIDRWWTLTRVVLLIQGVAIIILGLGMTPLFMSQIAADFSDPPQALLLFTCMVVLQGVKRPFEGAEGILIAQERFHWVPLRQTMIFWLQLATFAACLFSGLGLYSLLWAEVATLLVAWSLNWFLLAQSIPKLGMNFTGLQWKRVRMLFSFSFSIAGVAILDSFAKSLPVIILGRFGGLPLVPVYSISYKVATVLSSLGRRNYQSFYPALQRMFVQGELTSFRSKYVKVGLITVASSLGIAGFILCFNRTAVEVLASSEFYAGATATTWFAIATVTIPVSGFLQLPLFAAGKMGKSVLIALLQLILGLSLCMLSFRSFGINGLAAVIALLPLCMGAYGYFRGARECGFKPFKLSGNTVCWTFAAMILILVGGCLISIYTSPRIVIHAFAKSITLPGLSEILIGGGICLAAAALFIHALRNLRTDVASGPVSTER